MVLGGLWHGASWGFVAWGLFHGLLLVYERRFVGGKSLLPGGFAMIRTTVLVIIGWVLFRAPTVETALVMYRGMIGLNGFALSRELAWQLPGISIAALAIGTFVAHFRSSWVRVLASKLSSKPAVSLVSLSKHTGVISVFLLSVMKMLTDSYSPFLYFQF
jgi:alginate O-acetyltransferase complex protein AlgI